MGGGLGGVDYISNYIFGILIHIIIAARFFTDVPVVTQEYLSMMEAMPTPNLPSPPSTSSSPGPSGNTLGGGPSSQQSSTGKKTGSMPKWLQKGLFKK